MRSCAHRPWLHRFALFTAASSLALIGIGGMVTSHEAGLAVPDWPSTYGYNMFLFPPSQWIGGIFYEHTHRLFASFVGLLTTILAVWLWRREGRRWLRWVGVAAFFAVLGQGILGGLRVTLLKDELGIFHATVAQLFVVLMCFIALATSHWWRTAAAAPPSASMSRVLKASVAVATSLVFLQLVLGATMRHQHAGLAIPDFPLAYGKLWPPMDSAAIEAINRTRPELYAPNPVTAAQVGLHMAHRIGALLTALAVCWCAWRAASELGSRAGVSKLAYAWAGLILFQFGLGAATVLTNKAADVATAHVITGAASLILGSFLTFCGFWRGQGSGSVAAEPHGALLPEVRHRPHTVAA